MVVLPLWGWLLAEEQFRRVIGHKHLWLWPSSNEEKHSKLERHWRNINLARRPNRQLRLGHPPKSLRRSQNPCEHFSTVSNRVELGMSPVRQKKEWACWNGYERSRARLKRIGIAVEHWRACCAAAILRREAALNLRLGLPVSDGMTAGSVRSLANIVRSSAHLAQVKLVNSAGKEYT